MNGENTKQLEGFSDFADMSYSIYKETGIRPTDYATMDQYTKAILSKIPTEELSKLTNNEDEGKVDLLVKNELKQRGELS